MVGAPVAFVAANTGMTVANVIEALESQCGVPQQEIRLFVGQQRLARRDELLAALGGETVLSMIRVQPCFEWGLYEESAATVVGRRFTKTGRAPDYSTALSKECYSEGIHDFTFVCSGQAEVSDGTFIGVMADPEAIKGVLETSVDYLYGGSYYWSGGHLRSTSNANGPDLNVILRDLPVVHQVGDKVHVQLDCDAREVHFSVNDSHIGCITDLPQKPLHFFVCCDYVGDAWEVFVPE